jgi:hypothetical protein
MKIRSLGAGAARAVLILAVAAILAACAPPLDNSAEGNLRIVLAGEASSAARAVIDPPEDVAYYELDFSGPGDETFPATLEAGTERTLTLSLGQWTIRAEAFTAAGESRGSGETSITVEAGKLNEAIITLKAKIPPSAITAFSFADPPATGIVDGDAKTIAVTVPFGTDVTNLVPTITVSPGATVSPVSGAPQDFTGPVVYTVTAADGVTAAWTVTVAIFSFTVEGPGDLMVPVAITHSAGSAASTNISWSGNESLTFTVGAAYSAEAGNLKWLVNGEAVASAGNSLTIRGRDYILRTYTLTAMIKEQGQWYSGNYDFTVVR